MSEIVKIYFSDGNGLASQFYTFGRIVSEYAKQLRVSNDRQTFKDKRCFVVKPVQEHYPTSAELHYRMEDFVTLESEEDTFRVWKTEASEVGNVE